MKVVAIDTQTTLAQKTGFGFYVSNLVHELKHIRPRFRYDLIAPAAGKNDFSMPQRLWWDQIEFPRRAALDQADLLHQTAFSAPLLTRAKVVVTVHDLIARLFGDDIPFWSRQYFARWMPMTYRRANHIIAISEHTKKNLITELAIPEDKITVIYEGASPEFFAKVPKPTIDRLRHKLGIEGSYLVHIGTINPRKNLPFLVRSFAQVIRKHPKLQLVIAGKKGWYYKGLFTLVKELGLEGKVLFTGYLADRDKPALLQGSTALVFPSLYEGFGLPPLEAMASGIPVIASNSSSIPEVVGDGGLLADPTDEVAWVKAMTQIIDNLHLARDLSHRAQKQARRFSWEAAAEETAKIYAHVLGVTYD